MAPPSFRMWANWKYDLPASVVVFLVALPLCLGIALASGVPLFSGLIAGAVGGIVVGMVSRSPLSVSGPAAGLTVIVLAAVEKLPTLETFFLAVMLSGILQIGLGILRAGTISDFIPSAVIKGMLAAIGLILILKQIPHAYGYDKDYEGDESFKQPDGHNTFNELWYMFQQEPTYGALIISMVSLAFLFLWDSKGFKKPGFLKLLPGPLIVVLFGVGANVVFRQYFPALAIGPEHMVSVPVSNNFGEFLGQFRFPDFGQILSKDVWIVAGTLALVASLESLLSVEAVDKLDPFKRNTPTNRELIAQGTGNIVSGLLGGMPLTSVIVRSSANVTSGGRTRLSAISHGVLLLGSVIAIPTLLNLIPLSALAAVLISVGYKLTKPDIFIRKYRKGWAHLIPFVVTILAILFTDLLIGVLIGLGVGAFYVVRANYRSALTFVQDGNNCLIRFKKDLSFIHKHELRQTFDRVPENTYLLLDLSKMSFIDLDNAEIINDFIETASLKGIRVRVKRPQDRPDISKHIKEQPEYATV